jgi:hypothetical protein
VGKSLKRVGHGYIAAQRIEIGHRACAIEAAAKREALRLGNIGRDRRDGECLEQPRIDPDIVRVEIVADRLGQPGLERRHAVAGKPAEHDDTAGLAHIDDRLAQGVLWHRQADERHQAGMHAWRRVGTGWRPGVGCKLREVGGIDPVHAGQIGITQLCA